MRRGPAPIEKIEAFQPRIIQGDMVMVNKLNYQSVGNFDHLRVNLHELRDTGEST